ncbi:SLBB domain-containing protein [Amylibacter sp.]|jgi:protein involved in polysaccharide export with SLBB domain|nr:SLBB domain-containing protein [Amylibacter sp.]
MSVRFFSFFLIFILTFCQNVFAQSQEETLLQEFLLTNPSLTEGKLQSINSNEIVKNKVSKKQTVVNSNDNLKLRLNVENNSQKPSVLNKYFSDLIGTDLEIYGAKEFNQSQNDNLLFFNTLGKDYQLAPGDIIQVTITGLISSNKEYLVENDGTVTLQNMYPISIDGFRLEQVRKLLLNKILLDDASAEVFVRLKSARLVTVQISGNVESPRTIAVPAYTPLSRVLAYSGGVSDSGSLRNIALSQSGTKTQTIDFYEFLQNPSSTGDPLIKNGARIFVSNIGSTIAAEGFVNKPGIYELPKGISKIKINELLSLTGTSFIPPGAVLKVSYFNSIGQITTRLATKDDLINEGEALSIDFIKTRDLNLSKVSGAVIKDYEIKTNVPLSIKDVLRNGAVLNSDTYKSFALIIGKSVQAINLNKALRDESIILPVGSDLRLFTKLEYLDLVYNNTNDLLNPYISKLSNANIVKIYLDEKMIALVPLSLKQKTSSIKDVLKDGLILNQLNAVLNPQIFTPFGLVVGKKIEAFNLNNILSNNDIFITAGSDLRLFTKSGYTELVAEDPNSSLKPIANQLIEAKVSEIYLDGVRIAYVPISQDQGLFETIKDFYTPSAKTVYDISLIENNSSIKSFDFSQAINTKNYGSLSDGDRLFIFEDKFFGELISDQVNVSFDNNIESSELNQDMIGVPSSEIIGLESIKLKQAIKNQNQKYSEELSYSRKILRKGNVVNISLDGKLFTILPFKKGMKSSNIIKKLQGRLPKVVSEFILIQSTDINEKPKIKSLASDFEIKKNQDITFVSQGGYRKLIKNYETYTDTSLSYVVKQSDTVKVYSDEKLVLLLAPNVNVLDIKSLDSVIETDRFYKLFIGLNSKQNNKKWSFRSYDSATFFSETEKIVLGASNVVNFFTEKFIRDKFINAYDNKKVLNNADDTKDTKVKNDMDKFDNLFVQNEIKNIQPVQNENKLDYIEAKMKSNLRFVSGAVMFSGSYPVADKVRLSDLLDTVGIIASRASSNVIITKNIKENDKLVRATPEKIQLNDPSLQQISLTGEFYVEIPEVINDAITGFIELSGEFVIPGFYDFSRSETIDTIIQRAGGFTNTAYPLGAVLTRKSIKLQETKTNNILANQLEASVLTLAQSDIDGVGEQINAVLGFANQLRNQPTTGRMTLNVFGNNLNNPVYLQDGDKLTIPKRPSHVSVVGAVQRTTVAAYGYNKTFKDYILSAGGLNKMADIRKAYILLPNGESLALDKNTIIPAGSVLVIPPKIDKLSILGLTDIISRVLGNIATSILAINNVN